MSIPKDADKSQSDRFVKAARDLGADDDEVSFKAKLAVIARQKPIKAEPPVAATETQYETK